VRTRIWGAASISAAPTATGSGCRRTTNGLLGALYLAGQGVTEDLAGGRELSELGCERGDSFGCFNAAAVWAGGAGVPKDPVKAARFLERACDGGDGEGCNDLAVAYQKGDGVARDAGRAAGLFRKACDLGFESACAKVRGKTK
jgi:TPR repeat protein